MKNLINFMTAIALSLTLLSLPFGCSSGGGGDEGVNVGAAERVISPDITETYTDLNENNRWSGQLYNPEGGGGNEPFDDANGNGFFDAVWMANDTERPAQRVHDDLYVTAMVVEQGETRVAFVGIDAFGWFHEDMERITQLPEYDALGIDQLIMGASHNHETPDTIGLYGPDEATPGWDPAYMAFVYDQTLAAITEAVGNLEEATIQTGMTHTGLESWQVDLRDPIIIDDSLSVLRARSAKDDHVIATMMNWASHPEQLIDDVDITADYPGAFRDSQKARHPGQIVLFFNGALGGQIGSNHIELDWEGKTYAECGSCTKEERYARIAVLGEALDKFTEEAVADAVIQKSPNLSYISATIYVPLINVGFQGLFSIGVFNRKVFNEDGSDWDNGPIVNNEKLAHVKTELVMLRLGDAQMITYPGELHPEIAVGGYDGSMTPGGIENLWSEDHVHGDGSEVEDFSATPNGPYLRDVMKAPVTFGLGLTQDFLGYIIPEFNFSVHADNPYLDASHWDHHYEETNSTGPDITRIMNEGYRAMSLAFPEE